MSDKEQKIIEKKKIIINALKNCLERDVYSNISLEHVAREAGLSKGGLRHYFSTREELFIYLIEDFFNEIEKDQILIMQDFELDSKDKAFISTLFNIEKFLLDKANIKIFINLILYGFEDEKIMKPIKTFIKNHRIMYENIIKDLKIEKTAISDEKLKFIGRITQIILLCAGLFESIDPIKMDTPTLIEFFLKLYKE